MASYHHHGNGPYKSHINSLMTDSSKRHLFFVCEDGLKVSYCVAMNNAMAVRLWNLAYTTMWANTGSREPDN